MSTLSVVLITFNEEKSLARCLSSIKDIADEIVVVDSGSTDKTLEIAKKYNALIYKRNFDNYTNQKNYAAGKASCDWLLSLDADEEIKPQLSKEINKCINDKKFTAYTMPRENIIFKKFIKYTRWQPELDRHIWLWKRGSGKWTGDVHEELLVKGMIGKLINAKLHYQYDTVNEFFDMMNRYSQLDANQKVNSGEDFSYFRFVVDPKYNFFVRYIYRLGFLDGWRGFILSYLMGLYHLIVWIKIWEKRNR